MKMSSDGWILREDGQVQLFPVSGFKVNPGVGAACVLQFTYFTDDAAFQRREPSAVQFVLPLTAVTALREALEKAEREMQGRPDGPMQ